MPENKTILVVEDEYLIAELIISSLADIGFRAVSHLIESVLGIPAMTEF